MRTYHISYSEGQPDWAGIPVLPIDQMLWCQVADITAWAQLCWTPSELLLHFHADEPLIRAQETGPLGMPCNDSCLEFFFSPMEDDGRYLNIEFNPGRCLYLGIGTGRRDLTRLMPADAADIFRPAVVRRDTSWDLWYRIPCAFVRRFFPAFSLFPGKTIRANCFKCGDRTPNPHYFSWSPIAGAVPDFHRPDHFGEMRLAPPAPSGRGGASVG